MINSLAEIITPLHILMTVLTSHFRTLPKPTPLAHTNFQSLEGEAHIVALLVNIYNTTTSIKFTV